MNVTKQVWVEKDFLEKLKEKGINVSNVIERELELLKTKCDNDLKVFQTIPGTSLVRVAYTINDELSDYLDNRAKCLQVKRSQLLRYLIKKYVYEVCSTRN
jgi:hypothetical protein